MRLAEILPRLENVTPRGSRYLATCPAHADRSPSLQITEGDTALLVKCWAGCSLLEICGSLGIDQRDLFYDAGNPDPAQRRDAARQREERRKQRAVVAQRQGRRLDALRAADDHIRSRHGLDISRWSDQKLDQELNLLVDAYALLASEERDG